MNKLKKGLASAAAGILTNLVLTAILDAFMQTEDDPQLHALVLFIRIIFIIGGTWGTIKGLGTVGSFYLLGWIIGSTLFVSLLGPWDIVINIGIPGAILIYRIVVWIKSMMGD